MDDPKERNRGRARQGSSISRFRAEKEGSEAMEDSNSRAVKKERHDETAGGCWSALDEGGKAERGSQGTNLKGHQEHPLHHCDSGNHQ